MCKESEVPTSPLFNCQSISLKQKTIMKMVENQHYYTHIQSAGLCGVEDTEHGRIYFQQPSGP